MNREAMEAWVAALEDPVNEGRQIRRIYADHIGGVCALGLAREVLGTRQLYETLGGPAYLYVDTDDGKQYVAEVNDAGWCFWDIAQALRATHLKEST